MTVEEFGAYLWENGETLREQIRTRKYKPQQSDGWRYRSRMVEQETWECRVVVDRLVQQAAHRCSL